MSANDSCPARIGDAVRDFTFAAYNPMNGYFEKYSLSDFRKSGTWLILFFYPADFTLVCPKELAHIAEHYAALKELGAEVVTMSTDSKYVHLAWRTSEKLLENVTFLMGSDPTGELSRYFGVYDASTGLSRRGTFVISPEGVLACMEAHYYNVGRNAEDLLRKMGANIHFRELGENDPLSSAAAPANPLDKAKLGEQYRMQSGAAKPVEPA